MYYVLLHNIIITYVTKLYFIFNRTKETANHRGKSYNLHTAWYIATKDTDNQKAQQIKTNSHVSPSSPRLIQQKNAD